MLPLPNIVDDILPKLKNLHDFKDPDLEKQKVINELENYIEKQKALLQKQAQEEALKK